MSNGSCSLTEADLQAQLERYRTIGAGSRVQRHSATTLVVAVGSSVPDELVEHVVSTERSCCPFFEVDWRPRERTLLVAVSRCEQVPALETIAGALISD